MLKCIFLFNLICFCRGNFDFPKAEDELYITETYDIKWHNDLSDYHIYLLHRDTNSFISNTLSTYENGDLVLDDIVNGSVYKWNVPRNLNHYDLGDHSFKLVVTNSEGFSSSLTNNNNDYIMTEYFNVKTNMNVTYPQEKSIIFPSNSVTIEWNGFMGLVDISLEYLKDNSWDNYLNIETDYNIQDNTSYLWTIDNSINDLSKYDLRIKISEHNTDIVRYSKEFYSYGLNLQTPEESRYDYITLEENTLNISWTEDNSNSSIIKIDLLGEEYNFLETLAIKESPENYYLWDLEVSDYNKVYFIEIKNINSGYSQLSESFLINYLTTTQTSTTATQTSTQTSTTATQTSTQTSTTATQTSTQTSTSETQTSTQTSTSETQTSTMATYTSTQTSTMATYTSTQTSTTPTSNTVTTTLTSLTQSSTTTLTVTKSSTETGRIPLIIIDNIPSPTPEVKTYEQNRGNGNNMWILLILLISVSLIISFILCIKHYYSEENKIHNQENEGDIVFPPQIDRHLNPLYNKEDYCEENIYDRVPTELREENKMRLFRNVNYQEGQNNIQSDSDYYEFNGNYPEVIGGYPDEDIENTNLEKELEKIWNRGQMNPIYKGFSPVNI